MEVKWAMLAHDYGTDEDGRIDIEKVFDTVRVDKFPCCIPNLSVVINLIYKIEDRGKRSIIYLDHRDKCGLDDSFSKPVEFDHGSMWDYFNITVDKLQFNAPGLHVIWVVVASARDLGDDGVVGDVDEYPVYLYVVEAQDHEDVGTEGPRCPSFRELPDYDIDLKEGLLEGRALAYRQWKARMEQESTFNLYSSKRPFWTKAIYGNRN